MTHYDAIIVGARCAGSPLGMLLARRGYRVLIVDGATFPSDTVSSHVLHPLAVAALSRWGLLERLVATGCPPAERYVFNLGPLRIAGSPGTPDSLVGYCPRRSILDKLLVDAAREAGAEVREGFSVDELSWDGDRVIGIRGHEHSGTKIRELAKVVIGADGKNSSVAKAVRAQEYNARPAVQCAYYSYYSGLPMQGRMEMYMGERCGFGAAETHGGLTMIVGGWPRSQFETKKRDLEQSFFELVTSAPAFGDRVRAAKREEKISGALVPGFFRKPYGHGWALVGDAAYTKDPITAQGMLDAFRDAERLADALDDVFREAESFGTALGAYQRERDELVMPMYEFTCQMAELEPPPPDFIELLAAVSRDQRSMDRFVQMNAGTISPRDFMSKASIDEIVQRAA
jgi:2-polyprenyl-6-methoxyphenol hydroxylase-like FAD-dependent oxidoreductase